MKNWKTTLTGWIAGLIPIIDAAQDALRSGQLNDKHGAELVIGLALIILGTVAKDHNVSGGAKMLAVLALSSICSSSSAQGFFKPIPGPSRHLPLSYPKQAKISLSTELDSTFQGWRIGGPSVLVALPDLTVFTGIGMEYQHNTYTGSRWYKDWGVGLSLYEGGQFVPNNLKAVTALGLHGSLFDGFLTIGILYNFTTQKPQVATGPMTQLFPNN